MYEMFDNLIILWNWNLCYDTKYGTQFIFAYIEGKENEKSAVNYEIK